MTISSSDRLAGPFDGNGVAVSFPFDFKVFQRSDVRVVHTDTNGGESDLVLGTDHTVALNADQNVAPGGTVLVTVPPATGERITIASQVPATQEVQLTNLGGFFPDVLNNALDRQTILSQQLKEEVSRSMRLAISSPSGTAPKLPAPVPFSRLAWSADGTSLVNDDATGTTAIAAELASLAPGKGANMVGSSDGAGGTLWTTVSGFIARVVGNLGASTVGYLQSGADRVACKVSDALNERVTLKRFGGVADGGGANTNNGPMIQKFLDIGGTMRVSDGVYYSNTPAATNFGAIPSIGNPSKRFQINGDSAGNTAFWYAGVGTWLTAIGNYATEGLHTLCGLRDLTLVSVNVGNNNGITFLQAAYLSLKRLHLSGFNQGLTLTAVFTSDCEDLYLRANNYGLVINGSAFPDAANSLSIRRLTTQLNSNWAVYAPSWGEGNTIDGFSCESNGIQGNANTGGMLISFNHANGMGCGGLKNGYFELNKGEADLYIINPLNTHIVFSLENVFFNRAGVARFTKYNIKVRNTGGGSLTLCLKNVGFNSTSAGVGDTYVPDAARPFIDYDASTRVIKDGGVAFSEIVSFPNLPANRFNATSDITCGEVSNAGAVLAGPAGVTINTPATGVYEVTNPQGWGADVNGYSVGAFSSDNSNAVQIGHVRKNNTNTFTVTTVGHTGTPLFGSFSFQVARLS